MILQPLQSDTPYKITVVAVYEDGDGGQLTGNGRTGNYSFPIDYSFLNLRYISPTLQHCKLSLSCVLDVIVTCRVTICISKN